WGGMALGIEVRDGPGWPGKGGRAEQTELRVCRQRSELQFQFPRVPDVVRVEESDDVAAGGLDAAIARSGHPLIWLVNVPDSVTVDGQTLLGVVTGAVIYDDNLVRRRGLIERTVDRFDDEGGTIVRRDDNAHGSRGHDLSQSQTVTAERD